MKLTSNNEIKYTFAVPAVAELFALATAVGYAGKKIRKDISAFLKGMGYDCVYFSTKKNSIVLSTFA